MNHPINYFVKIFSLLLLPGLFFLTACDLTTSAEEYVEEEIEEAQAANTAPSKAAIKNFFIAWMADSANDLSSDEGRSNARHWLKDTARTHLASALSDIVISNVIGKETLVWGPALIVSEQLGKPYPYTIENLMYCTRTDGTDHYSVGIAGTNMVSSDDWLHEDFNVSWVAEPLSGGMISSGSQLGLEKLKGLEDENKTLLSFLQSKLQSSKGTVSVAGHSLGGALTQVYANYLSHNIKPGNTIEAWVYAGPTAGNQVFAKSLDSLLGANYHAYNNQLDVVPHVWQKDKLEEICGIYKKHRMCGWLVGENPIVNMVNQYLVDVSTTDNNNQYTMPGTPKNFSVDLSIPSLTDCIYLFSGLEAAWQAGYLKPITQAFIGKCKINKDNLEEHTYEMMVYLTALGNQHTTAYTNYFFQDNTLRTAVNKYANPHISDVQEAANADEGRLILTQFLANVYGHFTPSNPPSCSCG